VVFQSDTLASVRVEEVPSVTYVASQTDRAAIDLKATAAIH